MHDICFSACDIGVRVHASHWRGESRFILKLICSMMYLPVSVGPEREKEQYQQARELVSQMQQQPRWNT